MKAASNHHHHHGGADGGDGEGSVAGESLSTFGAGSTSPSKDGGRLGLPHARLGLPCASGSRRPTSLRHPTISPSHHLTTSPPRDPYLATSPPRHLATSPPLLCPGDEDEDESTLKHATEADSITDDGKTGDPKVDDWLNPKKHPAKVCMYKDAVQLYVKLNFM